MITRLQIIESMNPTLANAIYLAGIADLTPLEQSVADNLINTCLSNIEPSDLTDADKRQVLTLLKARPSDQDRETQTLEDFISLAQVEKLKEFTDNGY